MYEDIRQIIAQYLPDNEENLITPEWVRLIMNTSVTDLGSDANFMGIATPRTDLTTDPTHKQWYLTNGKEFGTYTTNNRGNTRLYEVRQGEIWMFYYFDSTNKWTALKISPRDNGSTGGRTPVYTLTLAGTGNHDVPIFYSGLEGNVQAVHVDGLELDPYQYTGGVYNFGDAAIHQVAVTLTADCAEAAPTNMFRGVIASKLVVPEGTTKLNDLGITTTALELPDSMKRIVVNAIYNTGATHLTLNGAPAAVDLQQTSVRQELSNLSTMNLSAPYRLLYQQDMNWGNAVRAIMAASQNNKVIFTDGEQYVSIPFVFEQALDSDTWNITHNMRRYPTAIKCFDYGGNQFEYGDIIYRSENELVIRFAQACTGKAYIS